jgi:general secretion pathway protein J
MTGATAQQRDPNAGFTLLEALIAMALMGIIMGALATVTSQWLPNWSRGLVRVQRNEQVAVALDRLVGDVSAAAFVSPNREIKQPLFVGTELSVTFVRSALGPNTGPGLEIVRIAETGDSQGRVLVRARAPFVPLPIGSLSLDQIRFADPVILLRAPLHVTFAYAGSDGVWSPTWQASAGLPAAVRFIARDATAERVLAVSSATRVHVDMAPPDPQEETPAAGNPNNAPDQPQPAARNRRDR